MPVNQALHRTAGAAGELTVVRGLYGWCATIREVKKLWNRILVLT